MVKFVIPVIWSARWRLALLMLLALEVAWTAAALGMSCNVKVDHLSARQGDVVVLTVTAAGNFGWSADFALPDIKGVAIAGGGTSQSVSMINGSTQASVSRTYYLTLTTDHDVTIGPVKVRAGKQECSTDPLTITVTPGSGGQVVSPSVSGNRMPRPQQQTGGRAPAGSVQGGKPGDDVFVTMETDRDQVFVGQQIILSFNYCRRKEPWNNPNYRAPSTEGFWREDLGTQRDFNRVIQGMNYSVTQVSYALFPTRSGDLVIEPAELQFPQDVFDRFFNSGSRPRGPRILRTDPVKVKVNELPAPIPAGFSGLVASHLNLKAVVDRDSVQTGDPVSLKVTLVSDAFLKGFAGLKITPAKSVRQHDSTKSFQTDVSSGRLIGTIKVEKILVPQQSGTLEIPPVQLVWFDSGSRTYRTAEAKVGPLTVTGGDLAAEDGEASGFMRSGLTRLGQDLAFIHPVPRHLRHRGGRVTGGFLWWILLVSPLALLALFRLYLDKAAADGRDPRRLRKRSWRRTRDLLTQAATAKDAVTACSLVAQAVRGYIAHCTGLTAAEIDSPQVREYSAEKVDEQTGELLVEVLVRCDAVRFSSQEAADDPDLVSEALRLLTLLDRSGKVGRRKISGTTAVLFAIALMGAGVGWPGRGSCAEPAEGGDPVRLLAEGNHAYTAGDLAGAEKMYLQVRAMGIDDPTLHFNLGNTFARQGKLGQAVASYLRAQRLDPRDQDVRKNLEWVRDNLRDLKLTQEPLPLFIAQISSSVDFLSLDEWGLICLALVWSLCLLTGWVFARGYWNDRLRRLLVATGGLLILVSAATGWRWYQDVVRRQGVVIADTAEVRSGPTTGFPVLFEVHDGLTVHLVGTRDDWLRISLGGDWTGWLPASKVEKVNLDQDVQGR